MTVLTYAELEAYWINAGGNKALAPVMAAIGLAESGGDTTATNPTDNNGRQTSWGLWQISDGTHNEVSPTWQDPATNAKLAVEKYNTQGLHAWGTYTTGKYKQYLQTGVSPQLPSGISGTQSTTNTGGVVNASLTSDVGSAITSGILSGIKAAIAPTLKWGIWFAEILLGLVVMAIGVIVMMQSSEAIRDKEKKALFVTPAGRITESVVGKPPKVVSPKPPTPPKPPKPEKSAEQLKKEREDRNKRNREKRAREREIEKNA